MIRISSLKLHIGHTPEDLSRAIAKKLRIRDTGLLDYTIVKQSLDARDKPDLRYVYAVDVRTEAEERILRKIHDKSVTRAPKEQYHFVPMGSDRLLHRPVIIGSGPAGLFAGYFLAMKGFRPILIERGEAVEKRIQRADRFFEEGILDPNSNLQFGEGGAGTFSDGKLNTGIKDPTGRKLLVLQTFAEHGAPSSILYQNKPHLGTDVLVKVIASMRKRILQEGGEYRFGSCFEEFLIEDGCVTGVRIKDLRGTYTLPADCVILAIGHSARDTFDYLIRKSPLTVVSKAFAVGVRAEHRQEDINRAQYGILPGAEASVHLPPADYKLTCHTSSGRSVYSFCMCPGGYVVNSSSEAGYQCINGMSYSHRDSENANSAIVAAVHPSYDPLENIRFQKEIEQKAWQAGGGKIISQRLEDFEHGMLTKEFGSIRPVHKGATVMGDINEILPEDICADLKEAFHLFGKRIEGYDAPDVVLSAVETRTSSPVQVVRDESMQSPVRGIYPIGEGAGYAGGITSAAIDGIKAFEKICAVHAPFEI